MIKMEDSITKILVLLNGETIISSLEEVPSELGEPDCKLVKPFIIKSPQINGMTLTLEPWLSDYTSQDTFMIHSDKILTITTPRATILEKYEELIK